MLKETVRVDFLIAFLGVSLLLAGSFFFQAVGYQPCPLCLLQRLMFMVIAVILLAGVWHKGQAQRIYSALVGFFAFLGGCFSSYQVWLQHSLANKLTTCSLALTRLTAQLPANVYSPRYPTGQCAVSEHQLLGLSFAAWALVFFGLLLLFSVWSFFKKNHRN